MQWYTIPTQYNHDNPRLGIIIPIVITTITKMIHRILVANPHDYEHCG
jgi:hypothetical protein